jgi:hypothetical protein
MQLQLVVEHDCKPGARTYVCGRIGTWMHERRKASWWILQCDDYGLFFYLSISDLDRGIKEFLSPGLMVTLF